MMVRILSPYALHYTENVARSQSSIQVSNYLTKPIGSCKMLIIGTKMRLDFQLFRSDTS
jgi:hypothetical protein